MMLGDHEHQSHAQVEDVSEYVGPITPGSGLDGGGPGASGSRSLCCPERFSQHTVLVDVRPDPPGAREEAIDPVAVASPPEDSAGIADGTNDTCFGLVAGLVAPDLSRVREPSARLRAGSVDVNSLIVVDVALGSGGFRTSGCGRDLGQKEINRSTETMVMAR